MKSYKSTKTNILSLIFNLLIFFAYIGSSFVLIDLGLFSLFPFRIFVFVLWFFLFVILIENKRIRLDIKNVNKEIIFLLFWLIYAIFSVAWAKDLLEAVKDMFYLFNAFSIVFFSTLFLKTEKDFRSIYKIILSIFVLFSIIAIWEVTTGNHLPNSTYYGTGRTYPSVIFVNTNDFSTYLTLTFPFLLSLYRYKKINYIKSYP